MRDLLLVMLFVSGCAAPSRQQPSAPVAASTAHDSGALAARLGAALRFPTISHDDRAADDLEAFDGLLGHLAESYPLTHALPHERVGRHALLAANENIQISAYLEAVRFYETLLSGL